MRNDDKPVEIRVDGHLNHHKVEDLLGAHNGLKLDIVHHLNLHVHQV